MISTRGTKIIPLQRRKSGLDFSIKGGKEHGIGVVVSWIKEGGAGTVPINSGRGWYDIVPLFQLRI